MTPENFVYWLQGYFELTEPLEHSDELGLTPEQIQVIREHIALVLKKETFKTKIVQFDHVNKNGDLFCSFGSGSFASFASC